MNKKFDFEVAQKLSETLVKTADAMELETEKIEYSFIELGETFKDKAYTEFRGELNAANKTVDDIVQDIRELNISILDYSNALRDVL